MKNYIVATINIFLLIIVLFLFQYHDARHKAVDYLNIINVDSINYWNVKSKIEDLLTDDVKVSLFESDKFSSSQYLPYGFQIHSINGNIIGLNDFRFQIEWTIYKPQAKRLVSVLYIENGIVVNASRVE